MARRRLGFLTWELFRCSFELMDDLDIPWKRYRRSKKTREDPRPIPFETRQDRRDGFSDGNSPTNIVPMPRAEEVQALEDDIAR